MKEYKQEACYDNEKLRTRRKRERKYLGIRITIG